VLKEKLLKFGGDLVSAALWTLFIIMIVVFANASSTQFIYNRF
jgi:hypothetical protein